MRGWKLLLNIVWGSDTNPLLLFPQWHRKRAMLLLLAQSVFVRQKRDDKVKRCDPLPLVIPVSLPAASSYLLAWNWTFLRPLSSRKGSAGCYPGVRLISSATTHTQKAFISQGRGEATSYCYCFRGSLGDRVPGHVNAAISSSSAGLFPPSCLGPSPSLHHKSSGCFTLSKPVPMLFSFHSFFQDPGSWHA